MLTGKVVGDILDADAKEAHLRAFAREHGAAQEQIIAMGDGANDLKMLGAAGFPVAYHAKPLVRQQTRYALNVSGLDGVLNWFES
ncbi:Phosphoserine phosphatase [compost metagenome]